MAAQFSDAARRAILTPPVPPQVYVPPLDWPPGALRPVINYGNFPRYVGKERRVPAYYPTALLPNATQNLIGHMPQVNHTFGYYEGDYAISNEHGLSFGESTCSARTYAAPLSDDSNKEFQVDIVNWSKVSQRIFIWDCKSPRHTAGSSGVGRASILQSQAA